MTKLLEWLFGGSVFILIWAGLLSGQIVSLNHVQEIHVLLLPIYLATLLGIYSVSVILYRVFTFNNCEGAADELKQQIVEAEKDLTSKGFTFH
ncbi:dolichol-phosphate mannosyltransferase subunit-like [Tropilaelaps mercedesae]|uniref:Dolichol-phosphate mannosyltransferase subunit 3 n=1 Tax=Tropilaelaps mercedesae TaxID=418985 RepID=A0A1V9XLL4_9ACAR|nr:dolichol-phosphate mannosyltransferase subunit-like [Tropilaelaps mercedesae]